MLLYYCCMFISLFESLEKMLSVQASCRNTHISQYLATELLPKKRRKVTNRPRFKDSEMALETDVSATTSMSDLFPGIKVEETIQGVAPAKGDPGYRTCLNLRERVRSCAWKTVEGCITRLSAVGDEKDLTLRSVTPELQALFQTHCKKLEAYKVGKTVIRAVAFGKYMHIHLNRDHNGIAFTLIYETHYEKAQDGQVVESVWAVDLGIILECGVPLTPLSRGAAFAEAEGEIAVTITRESCSIHSESTSCLTTTKTLSASDLLTMIMAPHSTCGSGTTA